MKEFAKKIVKKYVQRRFNGGGAVWRHSPPHTPRQVKSKISRGIFRPHGTATEPTPRKKNSSPLPPNKFLYTPPEYVHCI